MRFAGKKKKLCKMICARALFGHAASPGPGRRRLVFLGTPAIGSGIPPVRKNFPIWNLFAPGPGRRSSAAPAPDVLIGTENPASCPETALRRPVRRKETSSRFLSDFYEQVVCLSRREVTTFEMPAGPAPEKISAGRVFTAFFSNTTPKRPTDCYMPKKLLTHAFRRNR